MLWRFLNSWAFLWAVIGLALALMVLVALTK